MKDFKEELQTNKCLQHEVANAISQIAVKYDLSLNRKGYQSAMDAQAQDSSGCTGLTCFLLTNITS